MRCLVAFNVSHPCTCDVTAVTSRLSVFPNYRELNRPHSHAFPEPPHSSTSSSSHPCLGTVSVKRKPSLFLPLGFSLFNPHTMAPPKRSYAHASSSHSSRPQSSPDGRAPKQPRTSAYSGTTPGASQQDPVYIDDDDDDDDDEEEDASATQGFTEQEYSWMLYGRMRANIVGVRYYNGYATVGEMVVLRREPNNAYDGNSS
jgi:hypothetical protein